MVCPGDERMYFNSKSDFTFNNRPKMPPVRIMKGKAVYTDSCC